MARARGGYCPVCRSHYRTWAEHASSEKHRAKQYRHDNPSSGRKGHKRLARDASWRRSRRQETDPDEDKVRVRPHRRRPPLDGQVRRVKVRKYRRARPWVDYAVRFRRLGLKKRG